jgi:hypothetical protein
MKAADGVTELNVFDQPIHPLPAERKATRRARAMPVLASLPKIVRFVNTVWGESGEMECPHCGARGTVVHTFELEGGRVAGAMSGCIKLFPVSPIANEDLKIRKKEADQKRGKGYGLNRWDKEVQRIIGDFYAGVLDERAATVMIKSQRDQARAWAQRKYGR